MSVDILDVQLGVSGDEKGADTEGRKSKNTRYTFERSNI
jgi:hypothetical protein